MAIYCLDASGVLAWLLKESAGPSFEAFLARLRNEVDQLVSAEVLRAECTSAIRFAVRRDRVDVNEGRALVADLLRMPIALARGDDQFMRAYDLAIQFDLRKAYDMQYVAVAQMNRAELVTCDKGQRDHAEELGIPVRFLG